MTILNVSPSNSETGTPPKEVLLNKSIDTPSCSATTHLPAIETRRESKIKAPVATLSPVPEKSILLDDMSGEKANDHSPTDYPKYGNSGKILTCHCPPDADLPNLNLREFR